MSCDKVEDNNALELENKVEQRGIKADDNDGPWEENGQGVLLASRWIPSKSYLFRQITDTEMDLPLA